MIISISHIKLTGCELRVMRLINGFIPKAFANLIDSIQSANNAHLQKQFRRYPHKQLHIQIIVVSDKRFSSRTARYHIHHWSLHFHESQIIQKLSHKSQNFVSYYEIIAGSIIHYQVQVPHSVTSLLIL